MNMKAKSSTTKNWLHIAAILTLFLATPLAITLARPAAADEHSNGAEDAAIKAVVAGFSNAWNTHDAHALCISLADDVEWVNWRGEPLSTRAEVEDEHAKLFADLYKNSHRTDMVKTIHYINPELALVDDYWTMTGARKRDGSDWPYRAGLYNFVMAKRGGRWIIIVSHAADFNAQAPGSK